MTWRHASAPPPAVTRRQRQRAGRARPVRPGSAAGRGPGRRPRSPRHWQHRRVSPSLRTTSCCSRPRSRTTTVRSCRRSAGPICGSTSCPVRPGAGCSPGQVAAAACWDSLCPIRVGGARCAGRWNASSPVPRAPNAGDALARRHRIARARELLLIADRPVAAVGAEVGIPDPVYFARVFRRRSGCSPRAFRRRSGPG